MRVRGVCLQMFGDPSLWRFQVDEQQDRELAALLDMIARAKPYAHGEDWDGDDKLPNLVRIRTQQDDIWVCPWRVSVVSFMGWMDSEEIKRALAPHAPKPKEGA